MKLKSKTLENNRIGNKRLSEKNMRKLIELLPGTKVYKAKPSIERGIQSEIKDLLGFVHYVEPPYVHIHSEEPFLSKSDYIHNLQVLADLRDNTIVHVDWVEVLCAE